MVSGTRCPFVSVYGCEVVRRAAAPKGPMTYAVSIGASRLGLGSGGWNSGLQAEIWAQRLGEGGCGGGEGEGGGENSPYV